MSARPRVRYLSSPPDLTPSVKTSARVVRSLRCISTPGCVDRERAVGCRRWWPGPPGGGPETGRWQGTSVELQPRFHTTRGALFAYRVGSGRRENWVSRWVLPRAPGLARNVRAAAALAGWLWRVMWRADRAGGGAHGARRDPSPQTTDSAGWIHMIRPAAGSRMDWRRSSSACLRMDPGAR